MNRSRGFTLIELLVVIAIIALLSSVVLASLNSARLKARDAERLSDLHNIRLALELYYDAHGYYPDSNGWDYSSCATWATLQTALAPYMAVPKDPKTTNCASTFSPGYYSYGYIAGPAYPGKYDLVAMVEDTSNPQRCAVHPWYYHTTSEVSWCGGGYNFPNLIADH